MAGPKPSVDYNPVASVESGGGGGTTSGVRANAATFGAQVGEAVSGAGKQLFDISEHYAKEATESKANDILANEWSPTIAKLRTDYDSLQGQDKVHGYQPYISSLRETRNAFLAKASTPLEKEIISNYTRQHVVQEEQGATRELAAWQKDFSQQSTYDLIKANANNASKYYNDPKVVESTVRMNDALITKNSIDNGVDPNSEDGKAIIGEAQRESTGKLAVGMIDRATATGDIAQAYKIRQQFGPTIPGNMQLVVDETLHQQSMQQTGAATVSALRTGKPVPNAVGAPPSQVQAVVANTAVSHGLDHNDALAVLRIESNDGQNVGQRGDIGQTGKGGDLNEQAQNLVIEKKKANDAATKALGRVATPAEGYICYQQGGAGGATLLKVAESGSQQTAVDALLPFYKSRKIALEAVVKNGGNAAMTCSDFVDFLKNKYDSNAKRSSVELAGPPTSGTSVGEAILKPHLEAGPVVQPGASPTQDLINFNKKAPEMLSKINGIPNIEMRKGVLEKYNSERTMYEGASRAYLQAKINEAMVIATKPDFTSMSQLPPELYSALALDHPQTIPLLERRAESNLENNSILPLDFNDAGTLGVQIAARVSAARTGGMADGKIFRKKDSEALAQSWDKKTVTEKMDFLSDIQTYLPDSQDYQAVMQNIRPDSPVTAMAGGFIRLQGETKIQDKVFSADEFVTPDVVARKLLAGEELLNPTKYDRAQDGKSSVSKTFPMPPDGDGTSDDGLRDKFNTYVGNSLRGMPQLYDQTYQAYKAYYAAEASENGVYETKVSSDIADRAAKAVMGTVVEQNDLKVIAPWGMDESTFNDRTDEALNTIVKDSNLNTNFVNTGDVQYENTGEPGTYRAVVGAGYLIDKNGIPIKIKI